MNAAPSIRVVVGERNTISAEALGSLLGREPDLEVIGTYTNGLQLVEAFRQLQPDVMTLDSHLAEFEPATIIRQLSDGEERPNCLVLLDDEQDEQLGAAIQSGATGLVTRNASPEELLHGVRTTATGQRNMTSTVQQRVIAGFAGISEDTTDALTGLTDRERNVLKLAADGQSFSTIGQTLGISARTAETHRSNLARKLGLSSQTQIVRFAIRNGIIKA